MSLLFAFQLLVLMELGFQLCVRAERLTGSQFWVLALLPVIGDQFWVLERLFPVIGDHVWVLERLLLIPVIGAQFVVLVPLDFDRDRPEAGATLQDLVLDLLLVLDLPKVVSASASFEIGVVIEHRVGRVSPLLRERLLDLEAGLHIWVCARGRLLEAALQFLVPVLEREPIWIVYGESKVQDLELERSCADFDLSIREEPERERRLAEFFQAESWDIDLILDPDLEAPPVTNALASIFPVAGSPTRVSCNDIVA